MMDAVAIASIIGILIAGTICVAWMVIIVNSRISARHLPTLIKTEQTEMPKISVILPARDEEDYVGLCLRTLVKQDYPKYEIIAIDDRSEDATYSIMWAFARKYPDLITVIKAPEKPAEWVGKTWACVQGCEKATGDLLLFTDADTEHKPDAMGLAVNHMLAKNLDVLTLTQKIKTPEFWTRITMPVITGFKLAYPDGIVLFSAKAVNDPKNKMGGLLGAYFLIKKSVYDAVEGHAGVKNEILEDWVLGRKIKRAGYSVNIANGGSLVTALWARDLPTLDQSFTRLMAPIATNQKGKSIRECIALVSLLFAPYVLLLGSIPLALYDWNLPTFAFVMSSLAASVSHIVSYVYQAKSLGIPLRNAIFAPLAGYVASTGFINGLRGTAIWHEQKYQKKDIIAPDAI